LTHELIGRIAYAEKEFEKAVSAFEKSNLQNPYNIYRLALAYEGKGDKANADKYFKRAKHFNVLNSLNYAFVRNK
jgi:tetratricopeptide (TPR) repeat protein